MYRQSVPSCNAIRAVYPSYTPGQTMNFSGSDSMTRSFCTAVSGFTPLTSDISIPSLSARFAVEFFQTTRLSISFFDNRAGVRDLQVSRKLLSIAYHPFSAPISFIDPMPTIMGGTPRRYHGRVTPIDHITRWAVFSRSRYQLVAACRHLEPRMTHRRNAEVRRPVCHRPTSQCE